MLEQTMNITGHQKAFVMTKNPKKAKPPEVPATDAQKCEMEAAAVAEVREKKDSRARAPNLKIEFDENGQDCTVMFDHEDQRLAYTLAMYDVGTGDTDFMEGILRQVTALGAPGKRVSREATNFALSVIRSIKPENEVEALLATQMAATHLATMAMAGRLNRTDTIQQQDSAERALNKLARTFTTQVDTMKRYRAKAQQTVRVERVTVEEGGQAVVGDVSYQRGAGIEK